MNLYNDDFYIVRDEETRNAANTVLSIVSQIFSINSMVDVGCGVGTWLNEFHKIKKGQCNIVGIDGNYVNRELLTIEKDRFLPMDLESQIELSEKFDLAEFGNSVFSSLSESRGWDILMNVPCLTGLDYLKNRDMKNMT